ncbi:hypothetical protein MMC19_006789 [Ptychographa xylographoides]|nr:hypothetical protein [Ptychographa xylographoides]
MNHDNYSALRAFATTPEYYGPQGTISLAETSLLTPTSPESFKSSSCNRDDDKKPTKKRKSWGQELPTPKTNLPPRKRAKTEDEKEQRRIERVLRNRQAAQSSRERKRQEVEKLEGEKYTIERQNYMLKQRLLAVEHEKYALRQQLAKYAAALQKAGNLSRAVSIAPPSAPPSPNMVAADLRQIDTNIKQEFEDIPYSLPSPQNTLDPRSSFSSASSSSSRSPSPANLDFNGPALSSDMTQHPAAMLCGLQCQSEAAWRPLSNLGSPRDEARSPPHQQRQMQIPYILTTLRLFLTLHSVVSSTLLQPFSQLLTSLKTGLPMTSSTMTPTFFPLILWLISTPVNPLTSTMAAISSPSTSTTNTTKTTSTSSPPATLPSAFRISLLRRLLACSPALARPLKDATGRALQMKTSYALRGIVEGEPANGNEAGAVDPCDGKASRTVHGSRPRQEVWQLMTMALVIDQFRKERKEKRRARRKSKRSSK